MKQPNFKAQRDAWGTIRGYVYQVDLTIQRWLELQPDFQLELERGEDVDTIHRAMKKRGKTQARLLEQIKARERNVTLRSSAVLGSLAYFYEHERNNSDLDLRYRYVTNAQITKEQNSSGSGNTPLLKLWNQLTQEKLSKRDQTNSLRLIRRFLRLVRRPRNFPVATWKPFAEFIKSANGRVFESFLLKVEWLANQTATALVGQKIQEILISVYGTPIEQAQTVYSVLFLHVFKLLTQRGVKRLTTADRDNILSSPHVAVADQALFANLSIYLTNLSERVDALEKAVSVLQPRVLPTASEIGEACRTATQRLATVILEGRKIIDRENLREEIDRFLSSEERYLVVLGPSGVGKSISEATEALRLIDRGVAMLLVRGKQFSLEQAAQSISQEIWPAITGLSWQKAVEMLAGNESTENADFVLCIDAIDEADDLHQLSAQLANLHDSIGATSPKRVKIIMSCRDIAWSRFSQQRLMPLYESSDSSIANTPRPLGGYASTIARLSDFTNSELDRALQVISATELINPGRFGETASAHIATVREMLKHPATFEHYAALRQNSDALSIQNITWTYLIDRRLHKALKTAGRQSRMSTGDLRKAIERLAILSWQTSSKNFQLSQDEINSAMPELSRNDGRENISPLVALIDNRVLSESAAANQPEITFYSSDLGAFLLSFELARQIKNRQPHEVRELLKQWLKESWNFPPLLDALLALLDRLLDQPYSSASLAMVEVLVESNRFHNSSIFELMRPDVLKTIFEIIKHDDDGYSFYDYRDAALGVRPSPAALEEVRSHWKDENARVRQVAAELAGAHQDNVAVDELIQLLRDPDDDVQDRTFRAFGHMGEPAVMPLLNFIDDNSQPLELRSSCITALRNVGLRPARVSTTLEQTLKQAKTSPELIESSLLTAAGLRDRGHSASAKNALRSEDEPVVLAAAKYLTEVPEPGAFSALRQLLKPQPVDAARPYRRAWVINQAIRGLWETNRVKAAPVLLRLVDDALRERSELQPVRAIHLAEKIDLPAMRQLVFKHLIKRLMSGASLARESAQVIGGTWRTDHLKALINQNRDFAGQGIDTAKLFVDAITPGIQESDEFRIGDRLNLVSDLHTLAKCHAKNFAPEAARLFEHSSALGCGELSKLLWICGDTRSESALIRRFENPSLEQEAEHERRYVSRALGTCGGPKGARIVLSYLRDRGHELCSDFPQTTLYPLLARKLLSFRQLSKVARDPKMNWWSRASTLIALSDTNPTKFGDLFADVAQSSSDQPRLQAQAVRLLYFTKDLSKLRQFLSHSEHPIVKAQAAECLAWLDDVSSVHKIERALEESPALGSASALARLHQASSLPVLLDRLGSAEFHRKSEYLQALGAFWRYPEGRNAILDQFDRWSDPEERHLNNQGALITGPS